MPNLGMGGPNSYMPPHQQYNRPHQLGQYGGPQPPLGMNMNGGPSNPMDPRGGYDQNQHGHH